MLNSPHLCKGKLSEDEISSQLNHGKYRCTHFFYSELLPARASEQGNVIGSVRIYIAIYIYNVCVQKKFVIEQTRDLNYLKFVATDKQLASVLAKTPVT